MSYQYSFRCILHGFALTPCIAFAQTATVRLESSSVSVLPGSSVAVSIDVDFDPATAGSGVFGPAGLYGFGGTVEASGDAAANSSASDVAIHTALVLGPIAEPLATLPEITRAAGGRELTANKLTASPQTVMTFDIDIDSDAVPGDVVTVRFTGSVVLSLGDDLLTFSTSPGVNQEVLGIVPLNLTIASSRLCADQNLDGQVMPNDFTAWIDNFNAGNLVADVNQDGTIMPNDFTAWIDAFNQGSNGPTCMP